MDEPRKQRWDKDMNKILEAAAFAAEAHRGQTRKWGHTHLPYIVHPMRVAGMAAIHPDTSETMVVAAWLHDVVEDSGKTLEDVRMNFGRQVADLVDWLTNASKGMKAPRAERRKIDREKLSRAPWMAKLLKLLDRIDNLTESRDDKLTPPDFVKLYRAESLLLLDECLRGVDGELEDRLRWLAGTDMLWKEP